MEPTNNPTVPNQPAPVSVPAAAPDPVAASTPLTIPTQNGGKNKISVFSILILILVVLIFISWNVPVPSGCGGRAGSGPAVCSYALPALLSMPIIILSGIVGISFVGKMLMLGDGKNPAIQLFNLIVGLGVGGVIIIVGFFAGLIGGTRATGSV